MDVTQPLSITCILTTVAATIPVSRLYLPAYPGPKLVSHSTLLGTCWLSITQSTTPTLPRIDALRDISHHALTSSCWAGRAIARPAALAVEVRADPKNHGCLPPKITVAISHLVRTCRKILVEKTAHGLVVVLPCQLQWPTAVKCAIISACAALPATELLHLLQVVAILELDVAKED